MHPSSHAMRFDPDSSRRARAGKILVLLAIALPSVMAVMALYLDGGLMQLEQQRCQHAADAAATAAALALLEGGNAAQVAEQVVHSLNALPDAAVSVVSPPTAGVFAGEAGYVEVTVAHDYAGFFTRAGGLTGPWQVGARSVAGRKPSTAPAAVVLLDADPPPITLGSLPIALPSLTPLLGGLEVLGLGSLRVEGAVLVNNLWGGVDQQGQPVNNGLGLGNACSCTPLIPLTHLQAADVRVVGGVDNPSNYKPLYASAPAPLQANRRPVPDPYSALPPPTTSSDPLNVSTTNYGGVTVVNLPLLQPPHVLRPGVYDWITVVSGRVVFEPGVYIIRGRHPVTNIGLNLLTGSIQAQGVLFYLTNAAGYSPVTGLPDGLDGPANPGGSLGTLFPSALIDASLLNSRFSGLNSPGSPLHGLLIYQRRVDRRPIVIVQQSLLGTTEFSGNVYARAAHVILTAHGTYRSAFAVGSLRSVTVLQTRIEPQQYLPPAYDVYLVE